jgi:hypothetical protein
MGALANSQSAIITATSVIMVIDFIAVGLRLWSRKITGKRLNTGDYLIVVAMVRSTFTFAKRTLLITILQPLAVVNYSLTVVGKVYLAPDMYPLLTLN